jgi:hypothetical protein
MKEPLLKPLPTDSELAHLIQLSTRYRRVAGVVIGAGLGLVYGAITQSINSIVFPGLPFHLPPYGPVVNTVLCFLGGASLGLLSAWPQESAIGILIASVTGALVIGGTTLAATRINWESGPGVILIILFLMLPITAIVVPFVASVRWATNKQEDSYRAGYLTGSRVLAPLLLLIVTGGLAATTLYPPEARPALERVNALVQAGQAATDVHDLPEPFKSDAMAGFLENAQGTFTLEWNRQFDRYGAFILPGVDPREQSVVVVYLQNGWTFACLFASFDAEPVCKNVPH